MKSTDQTTARAMEIADRIAELVLHPKNTADALDLTRELESVLTAQARALDNVTYITNA